MPGPPMLGDGSSPTYMCVHGGTWTVSAGGAAVESGSGFIGKDDEPSSQAPCLSTPPSMGLPKCTFESFMLATGSKKVVNGVSVLAMDIQMSMSNGIPVIPITVSKKVMVI